MNKTLIVLVNELKETLKRKGFIITTVAFPVLAALAILVFNIVNVFIAPSEEETLRVGYIDEVGIFDQYTRQGKVELVAYPSAEHANRDLIEGELTEYFIIPEDYIATGSLTRYSLDTDIMPPSDVMDAAQKFLVGNLVKDRVSPEIITRLEAPMLVSSIVLDETGNVAQGQGGWGAWLLSYLFGILLMMSIFTASGYLLQGLSEEKENRIMEILLSSVSTRQLIIGKVLGLGAAGLIQMVFWLLSAWGLMTLASFSIGGVFSTLQFPANVIILSLVYFILGYFLFAVMMAGVGAIAPTVRDGQQLSVIFSLVAAIPFVLMTFIIENGDHILNIILTLFPPTAPMTVMIRLNGGIPLWEIIADRKST
ncbi:MAG: ABC transporter permease, partial [Dehalococcoidales bacterium]|nr:ABC transporter permease [Dehalococcoidales bacterium]